MAFRGTDFAELPTGRGAERTLVAALNEQLVLAADATMAIEQGADKDHAMYDGQDASVLGWAAKFGHLECVQILLAAGADVAAQDATPLH